ncbi:MAG TPA: hypothetical protein PKY87_03960 [Terricaulis sp.]|nr:hypothetical protein [Terricaulis sp.]
MSATDNSEASPPPPAAKPQPGAYVFLARVGALIAAALLAVLVLVLIIPEGHDYQLASNLKHDALERHEHKIVLVGGSNLSYGVDSGLLERATQCPVVNMGMNGFFGVRFMLEEVKPYLNPGDTVVIAFEHETYVRPAEGSPESLLVVTKANPRTLQALSLQQIFSVAMRYPYAAHQKMLRLLGDQTHAIGRALGLAAAQDEVDGEAPLTISQIESFSGFDARGDLVSHLNIDWPDPPKEEEDVPAFEMTPEAFALMEDFVEDMSERGVRVIVSYSAAEREFYEKHREAIESWDARFRENPAFVVPRSPSDYVFDASMHFDTVYHLNAEGRAIRSQMLAEDIVGVFPGASACAAPDQPQERPAP